MAEGFRSGLCSGNWWSNTTATTTTASDMGGGGVNVSYGSPSMPWSSDQMADINAIKALSSTSSQESDSIGGGGGGGGGGSGSGASVLMDSSLQMMDFGLSCPTNDHWSQALLNERSSIDHVFNLEQQQHQDHSSPSSSTTNNSSSILRGLFEPSDQQHLHPQHHQLQNQHQLAQPNYMNSSLPHQFLKTSPPKQQLHFTNNTAFWNPTAAMTNNINNSPPGGFFSSSPSTLQAQVFDEKANCSNLTLKTNREEKKSNSNSTSTESTFKRPRIETPTPLPTFKVRKEKLGDRITALQQLVSPFGKTDTASVLFEAIEYIKFLHEQVGALSTPYMKSGSSHHIQYQQNSDKLKDHGGGSKQDLRSRGLCLVPISSTFPVATESSADFWTPTYGGTYR